MEVTPVGDADDALADDGLLPIDEVARRFDLRSSALRYYERRGLLHPAARRAGRRWYGPTEIRRLAMIGFWQHSGSLSLDEVAAILAGPETTPSWKRIVADRIAELDAHIERTTAARDYLQHVLACPREHSLDGCPYFEDAIWQPVRERTAAALADADPGAGRAAPESTSPRRQSRRPRGSTSTGPDDS